eukprot:744353-Rhodomonas_salina.2
MSGADTACAAPSLSPLFPPSSLSPPPLSLSLSLAFLLALARHLALALALASLSARWRRAGHQRLEHRARRRAEPLQGCV